MPDCTPHAPEIAVADTPVLRKRGRPTKNPLTEPMEATIGKTMVRDAICAQNCGSYSSVGIEPRWYVVETHPGAEFDTLLELTKQKFRTYLPLFVRRPRTVSVGVTDVQIIDAQHVARPRKHAQIRPVFPRYLFVQFDPGADQWRVIPSTTGVRRLISYSPERPTPIPDMVIVALQRQGRAGDGVIDSQAVPDANYQGDALPEGVSLRVKGGPFAAVAGICKWSTTARVAALMEIMGSLTVVEFRRDQVEAAR